MTHLMLVAHGSRREQSNDEMRQLPEKLKRLSDKYTSISTAFLEIAKPSIPEGLKRCIEEGASSIIVVPCFLSSGRHVAEDIPSEVSVIQRQHPNIAITLTAHLGDSAMLLPLLLDLAEKSEKTQ